MNNKDNLLFFELIFLNILIYKKIIFNNGYTR